MMVGFIDQNRQTWGIEPICDALPIAPSTYHEVKAGEADPSRLSARRRRDIELRTQIQKVWDENFQVYGPKKVWNQLRREGVIVGRGRIERLMKQMGLKGTTRGQKSIQTTFADPIIARRPKTSSKGTSMPQRPTNCGLLTLPTWSLGLVLSLSPSLSTRSPRPSWAGGCRQR